MKTNINKSQKYVNILGFNICSSQLSDLLTSVEDAISYSRRSGSKQSKFSIFTPNPELLLQATQNKRLSKALYNADYMIPDGIGLLAAANFIKHQQKRVTVATLPALIFNWIWNFYILPFKGEKLESELKLVKGRVLTDELFAMAAKNYWKVFLLGGIGKEAEMTATKLKEKYPSLTIEYFEGPKLNQNAESVIEIDKKIYLDTLTKINNFKPDLLFVAFGNPKQEIFIDENLRNLKVSVAITVGGAFRYISGMSKFPPLWISKVGMEWLWRLITEPIRLKRIFNAVIVFPIKVLTSKFN